MKPAGRALKIVAVGLGQGGGNLAAEFHRRGYAALALNTAHTDLSSLGTEGGQNVLPADQRVYIGIDGYDGAGADLSFGRECIAEQADRIREVVQNASQGADLVLLTAGLGGGTGSAIGELVNVLKDVEMPPLIAMVTLPHEHESGIAKVNAVRAASALVSAPLMGWIFIDNARIAETHRNVPMAEYYPRINSVIVDPLDAFNVLNQREGLGALRALDGEDFRRLLLSTGVLNYAAVELPELSVEAVMQAISESVNTSALMPSGFALEQASHVGLVIEASAATLEKAPFSLFEQISEQVKNETGGAALYLGVYRTSGNERPVIRLLCSSRGLPERLQDAVTEAKREGGTIRDKLQQALSTLDLGEIEDLELFQTHTRSTPPASRASKAPRGGNMALDTSGLGSLTPPRPSARPRSPEAKPANGSGAQTSTKATSTEPKPAQAKAEAKPAEEAPSAGLAQATLDIEAAAAEVASGGSAPAAEADREVYDRLVQEFQSADSEDARKRVVQRLEADRCSDNTLVRYYAVKAMTKLNDPVFERALLAATEDEDRTVRAIATKALQR